MKDTIFLCDRRIRVLVTILIIFVLLIVLTTDIILQFEPMFIKTIDRPNDGVGEVIIESLAITGFWIDNPLNFNSAFFNANLTPLGLSDYHIRLAVGHRVLVPMKWENGHWVGSAKYLSTKGEIKTVLIYTDESHSVWAFEFEDRVVYAPASNYDDYVPEICELLNIESK